MDATPAILRLRGTFIDFGSDVMNRTYQRSASEPARKLRKFESEDNEYLFELIEHTWNLSQGKLCGNDKPSSAVAQEIARKQAKGNRRPAKTHGFDSEDTSDRNMSTTASTTTTRSTNHDTSKNSDDAGSDDETLAPSIDQSISGDIVTCHNGNCGMQPCSDGSGTPKITTLMLCDIPCRIEERELRNTLTMLGFADTYDFLHMPMKHRGRRHHGNLGYAFVNFKSSEVASRFAATFVGFRFPCIDSKKLSYVKPAAMQGYEANLMIHSANRTFLKHHRLSFPEAQ